MKRKLIAIDIDGTLINDQLVLTSFSAQVLRDLAKAGHLIVLATGRPYRSLSSIYETIGLQSPVICYNGALVFNPKDTSFKPLSISFKKEEIMSIAKLIKDKTPLSMAESFSTMYSPSKDEYLDHYFPYEGMKIVYTNLDANLAEDVYTAIFRSDRKDDKYIKNVIESHPPLKYRHWTKSRYCEIYTDGVDKGSALRYIKQYYGISKEDTIAFGDSSNDYEMLLEAGKPFAMKDCKSHFLAAKFPPTIDNNNQDGVTKTLLSLLK
jgi:Cof subfamily protein (haloacid dehalogenase superfamily)